MSENKFSPGTKVKFKDTGGRKDFPKWREGKILGEYEDYFLIQTVGGYRECIDKHYLATNEARMEVMGK